MARRGDVGGGDTSEDVENVVERGSESGRRVFNEGCRWGVVSGVVCPASLEGRNKMGVLTGVNEGWW